eukprot:2345735-Pyramimonas_sp.AAC.1
MVDCVTDSTLFLLGGGDAARRARQKVLVCYAVEKATWFEPSLSKKSNAPPPGRELAAAAYHMAKGRWFIYGGWDNRWLGDLHVLDAASVVGPGYAASGVEPKWGPMSGGTHVAVHGRRFPAGQKCVV